MAAPSFRIYSFGRFTFKSGEYRLFRDGVEISLRNKRLEILAILLENAGRPVPKEDIFNCIWPDQIVEEANLTLHIHNLRRLLGDDRKNPSFILTIPGVGYMFVDDSLVIDPGAEAGGEAVESDAPIGRSESRPHASEATRRSLPRWLSIRAGRIDLAVLVGILCLAVGFEAGYLIRVRNQARKTARFSQLTTLSGIESYPDYSPDGRSLVFTSADPITENSDVYVKELAGGDPRRVTSDPGYDFHPVWSPDGRSIALLRREGYGDSTRQLIVIPSTGGDERMVATVTGGLDWAPDGEHLVACDQVGSVRESFLFLVPIQGGERRQLTFPVEGEFIIDAEPVFSPDGRSIAFLRKKSRDSAISEIHILDLASGSLRQLTHARGRITDIEWNGPEREIVYSSNLDGQRRLWRVPVTGGSPVRIDQINAEVERISLAPDGGSLVYTQALIDTIIDLHSLAGEKSRAPHCRINSSRADDSPRFSPDGRRLIFVSNRSGWDELWMTDIDCRQPSPLTNFQETGVGSPRWSPDGSMIAFDRREAGRPEIHLFNLVGMASRRLFGAQRADLMPSWSFDNRWIYFESNRIGRSQVWKSSLDGAELRQMTINGGGEAVEADQGRLLIYVNDDFLWQKDLQTGREQPIPELKDVPIGRYWDVVGSKLYFVAQTYGVDPEIRVLNLRSRQIRSIFTINGYLARWVPGISISPDERFLAVSYVDHLSGDVTLVSEWR
jgi:Tol biopolymer transport system component/DNA-binding winged helix-turn-helix (wHTH) protein